MSKEGKGLKEISGAVLTTSIGAVVSASVGTIAA